MSFDTLIRITLCEWWQQFVVMSTTMYLWSYAHSSESPCVSGGSSLWSYWQQCTYEVMHTHQNHPVWMVAAVCGHIDNNVLMKLCTLITITLCEWWQQFVVISTTMYLWIYANSSESPCVNGGSSLWWCWQQCTCELTHTHKNHPIWMGAAACGYFGCSVLMKLCTLLRITLCERGEYHEVILLVTYLWIYAHLSESPFMNKGSNLWSCWQQCTYKVMHTHHTYRVWVRAAACGHVGNNVLIKLCTLIRLTLCEWGQQHVFMLATMYLWIYAHSSESPCASEGSSMWSCWEQCTYEVMHTHQNHPVRSVTIATACGHIGNVYNALRCFFSGPHRLGIS